MGEGFVNDFKRFFLRGLAAVLPTVLTLTIIIYVITFVHKYIGKYINIAALWILSFFLTHKDGSAGLPEGFETLWYKYFWWVGFIVAIVGVYIFGRFVASFLGRSVWRLLEHALLRIPVLKSIYPHVKQVTDLLFAENTIKMSFSRVVAVEYPRKGIWSIGLVTGVGMRKLQQTSDGKLLTIFIPSSPMPVTGYTIIVRRDEVIDLPISIDDALRFMVSGGVITPLNQQLSGSEIERFRRGETDMLEQKESTE